MTSHVMEERIVSVWHRNAEPWTVAVREGRISSRVQVTNAAILEVIARLSPGKVLDIGCGEGWLSHALANNGIDVLGVDVVPALIAQASAFVSPTPRFQVMDYSALGTGILQERFDVAVCNFSLLGDASVAVVFNSMQHVLKPDGYFVIQTLHPQQVAGDSVFCADGPHSYTHIPRNRTHAVNSPTP